MFLAKQTQYSESITKYLQLRPDTKNDKEIQGQNAALTTDR